MQQINWKKEETFKSIWEGHFSDSLEAKYTELVLIVSFFSHLSTENFIQVNSSNFVNFCIFFSSSLDFLLALSIVFGTLSTDQHTQLQQLNGSFRAPGALRAMNNSSFYFYSYLCCSLVSAFALCDIPKNQIWLTTSEEKDTAQMSLLP